MQKGGETGEAVPFSAVILAAGRGTRMKSPRPKVLHPLLGRPMLWHVLQTVRVAGAQRIIVIIGHRGEEVQKAFADSDVEFVLQEPQLGTGHAVMQVQPLLHNEQGPVLVTCGDTPLLRPRTLQRLVRLHTENQAAATVLSARLADPTGYGRIVRADGGAFVGIVEEKDAGSRERAIDEINAGTYCFQAPALFEALAALRPDNAQGEYYLTDTIGHLAQENTVIAADLAEGAEWQGINSRAELSRAEQILQGERLEYWAREGVTIQQPSTVRVEMDVRLEPDCTLKPYTFLGGATVVESGATVGPNATLVNTRVGQGAHVRGVALDNCVLEPGARIGPGAGLPAGTIIGRSGVVGRDD